MTFGWIWLHFVNLKCLLHMFTTLQGSHLIHNTNLYLNDVFLEHWDFLKDKEVKVIINKRKPNILVTSLRNILFVCSVFFTHRGRDHCWATNFDLCSVLMAIEQWGFFSASHLLWDGTSINSGYFWRPVTFTVISERLIAELSLPVLST